MTKKTHFFDKKPKNLLKIGKLIITQSLIKSSTLLINMLLAIHLITSISNSVLVVRVLNDTILFATF